MSTNEELDQLKAEATALGIEYSGNISATTLKKRIEDYKTAQAVVNNDLVNTVPTSSKSEESVTVPVVTPLELAKPLESLTPREDAMRLVRVRVVPMDRAKRDYTGEFFSAGNSVIPTVKRFVQFNTDTHIENILYQQLKDKEYQYFNSKKVNGVETRESKVGKAYNIEVLPPLTQEELEELRRNQIARNAID